ncbi:MAG: PEP-CTERM sorting domain-containing protein [Verrucomicrobiales bacterium]
MKTPLLSALVLAALSAPSFGVIAYVVDAGGTGNQTFGGSLGMDFNVQAADGIAVNRLGVFDSGSDGLNLPISVGIFDRNTGLMVGTSQTLSGSGATLADGSRFVDLASPIGLPAGFQGSIVAWGYGAGEPNGNGAPARSVNSGGGNLYFLGAGRWDNAAGVLPANIDGGPFNRYAAGTFDFTQNNVIAPSMAYAIPAGTAGNQNFGGSLGQEFIVQSNVFVSQLSVFDDLSDGIAPGTTITAELWDNDLGTVVASEIFTANDPGTLVGGFRVKDLASDLMLTPGAYTIVAHGYNAAERNGNGGSTPALISLLNDAPGFLEFTGTSRFGTAGAYPGTPDGGPQNRYLAGNFTYSIPEPSRAALLLLGVAGVCLRRRR